MNAEESADILSVAAARSAGQAGDPFLEETGLDERTFLRFCKAVSDGENPVARAATHIQIGYELARQVPPIK